MMASGFQHVYCFDISCTKARKTNYLNSHGEEAQEKPPGLYILECKGECINLEIKLCRPFVSLSLIYNIIGDELLLHFGMKFQC